MYGKSVICVVIPLLIVALAYSSISVFSVFAAPKVAPSNADCWVTAEGGGDGPPYYNQRCCWEETDPGDPEGIELTYCQNCAYDPITRTASGCGEKEQRGPTPPPSGPLAPLEDSVFEQPPRPPPFDPTAPQQGGVLEQQEQQTPPPSEGAGPFQGGVLRELEQGNFAPGFTPGFLQQQEQLPPAEQGAAELPPPATTEETQPATVEEEPVQPCPEGQVLDEETNLCVLEEQEEGEEPTAEGDQPSEESDSEEDNSSN